MSHVMVETKDTHRNYVPNDPHKYNGESTLDFWLSDDRKTLFIQQITRGLRSEIVHVLDADKLDELKSAVDDMAAGIARPRVSFKNVDGVEVFPQEQHLCAEPGCGRLIADERATCAAHGFHLRPAKKLFDVALQGDAEGQGGHYSHKYRIRHYVRWDDGSVASDNMRDSLDGDFEVDDWEEVGSAISRVMTHIGGSGFTVCVVAEAIT